MRMNEKEISQKMVHYVLSRDLKALSSLTPKKVAKFFGLKIEEVHRLFTSVQNISLDKFINREKMWRALFIIENNKDVSLERLAKELGFYDRQIFEKEFQALLLIHPTRYQELIKVTN